MGKRSGPRPAKPEGVEGRPRHKGAVDPLTAAPLTPLSDVARQRPTGDELAKFFATTDEQPARTVALVGGSILEILLEDALSGNMLLTDRDRFSELFRNQGAPLHSWSAKTLLAHALGILGDEMRGQMDQTRKIRNAFAHAVRPIDFDHPTIAAECMKLDCRKMVRPGSTYLAERDDPRARYTEACQMMAVHPLEYLDSIIRDVKAGRRKKPETFRSKYA